MNTMVPTLPTDLRQQRVRLAKGPSAPAEARGRVRATIRGWNAPVDSDVAVLLTSELVTNALRHEVGDAITLAIRLSADGLRIDVHDTSPALPVVTDTPADSETGRGLVLVAALSADWGSYRTPAGKVVYFVLATRKTKEQNRL
jgi:anti-sigma regulatory factor (Ser/Thr protein kinase)